MIAGVGSSIRTFTLGIALACTMYVGQAAAQAQPLPIVDKDIHMGVASCAGSTCHGAVEPWQGSQVLQNEYITWQRQDKHAKAYQVLMNDQSKRIARNLGLENAHTADVCLNCHADNPSEDRRFRSFQIGDGVTCEACHGGAGRWIGTHISAVASHENNIANGLYSTAKPVSRARLCLSCHFGDENRFVTHKIMGAGHPRMSFELDTFTAIQPAHYKVDKDYRERKGSWNGVQTWAIGQAMAIGLRLDVMLSPELGWDGIFPELVIFDCYTCHHRMSNLRWEFRESVGLGPGIPRVDDSNLLMLQVITSHIDNELGKQLHERTVAMHKATRTDGEAYMEAAKALKETTKDLVQRFAGHSFGKGDMQALLAGVIDRGVANEYRDYPGAEQATMAVSAIINAMLNIGAVNKQQFEAMNAALEKCYAAVDKDEEYKPATFVAALQEFKAQIP